MKTISRLFLACILLALGVAAMAGEVKWGSSLKAALKQAKRTNHLIMVDFYADW